MNLSSLNLYKTKLKLYAALHEYKDNGLKTQSVIYTLIVLLLFLQQLDDVLESWSIFGFSFCTTQEYFQEELVWVIWDRDVVVFVVSD